MVDRLMSFDRDRDGVITAAELSERMQGLVARGDRSGDGALDPYEIRLMTFSPQFAVNTLSISSGSYGFDDSVVQSSRTHIENSIDDLRLAPRTTQEAKRLASAFADEFEGQPLTNQQLDGARRSALVARLSGVLTEEESDNLRAALARRPLVKRPVALAAAAIIAGCQARTR